MSSAVRKSRSRTEADYSRFDEINGTHSLQQAVPGSYVSYQARTRHGGEVVHFNFDLAREMGLIADEHPNVLTDELKKRILDTFALVIINEYDIENKRKFNPEEIRPNTYMATRYLQLQHPDKRGSTSGDGRGIWNGEIEHRGVTWDVSSCGTGATCLSPATAIHRKFFKTGDPAVSYGCGYAYLEDGLSAAVMSEIFHRNGVPTERTLALIRFPGGFSINVRAARNLIRPAHLFRYLKLGDLDGLRKMADYFIERQVANGVYPQIRDPRKKYEHLLQAMTHSFARASALFESDYIFCWLDWDGDNILAENAGIIDYGSVRQFGLYHSEYRYDDIDRFSTKLSEQKLKAKYIVQTYAQLVDALIHGRKISIERFRGHAALREFDRVYHEQKHKLLLRKMGCSGDLQEQLWRRHSRTVEKFLRTFSYFEERQCAHGVREVPDGLSSEAVFSMRDLLREYPKHLLASNRPMDIATFVEVAASGFASGRDLRFTRSMKRKLRQFQVLYGELLDRAAKLAQCGRQELLVDIITRSSAINSFDRVTGDGIINISQFLLKQKRQLPQDQFNALLDKFIKSQTQAEKPPRDAPAESKLVLRLVDIVREFRETI